MIKWDVAVEEYKAQYTDEDGIHEFIDSLVPIYYYDINKEFQDLGFVITQEHVGLRIWQVMTQSIYEAYMEEFMSHWAGFDEEE